MAAVMAAEPKAESDAWSIEADAWTVVARTVRIARFVVVLAVLVRTAAEAAIRRTKPMMPDARPAMNLVGHVRISDGAPHALRARKPDGAGGLSEESRRRQHGGARQDAKGFVHGYPLKLVDDCHFSGGINQRRRD